MTLAIVLVICATVIVVTYMLCRVREREQDLEDVYEDISLLRVSVDRFNSIEEVNANNFSVYPLRIPAPSGLQGNKWLPAIVCYPAW